MALIVKKNAYLRPPLVLQFRAMTQPLPLIFLITRRHVPTQWIFSI